MTNVMILYGKRKILTSSWNLQEKFQEYLCREGEKLRQQDKIMMAERSKAKMG